ncbi:unnamed protein product (macronuclear) [Paramecium tetraurelia]|uniref:Transmembrane protein n=1 Tax=Paramecium tetraurelia TaxID=5888 RepID=A0D6W5_PARTE|nr:uncharacterized protein GSPATT00001823001 [Paramecium tetraurelia]CAK78782.1 unnamed protein product [Paramecium tetraurelia]|eukprot:XP_001446179.1 hypothetical protein (macronuclear) [Paramecium tetraurelia strain d4-2]
MPSQFYDLRSNIQAQPLPFNYSIILRINTVNLRYQQIYQLLRAAELIEFILMIIQDDLQNYYISGVLFTNISVVTLQIIINFIQDLRTCFELQLVINYQQLIYQNLKDAKYLIFVELFLLTIVVKKQWNIVDGDIEIKFDMQIYILLLQTIIVRSRQAIKLKNRFLKSSFIISNIYQRINIILNSIPMTCQKSISS